MEITRKMLHSPAMDGSRADELEAVPVLRFGIYEADLQSGELRKSGLRLRLQGQPFQVLSALLRRPGELVTREELRQAIWPADTFVDFDHALNTAIKKIRAVLGDDADNPRFIATVPRRGYRFLAPVEQAVRGNGHSTLVPVPAVESAAPASHRWIFTAVIGAAVVLISIGWTVVRWRSGAHPPEFLRLTFDLPELGDARFTPDGASVVYSAGWHPRSRGIFTQRFGAPGPQPLGILPSAALLSVSRQGELAVLVEGSKPAVGIVYRKTPEILARAPLSGGAPRQLLPDIEAADWSPDGQLAVVRRAGEHSRLEFPPGKVLYETTGWIANPRFSPRGEQIAFLDHPVAPDDRGSVAIVDLKGTKRTLAGFWESERGLAWNPRGDEVWFAAARSGLGRALYAVTLNGGVRQVLSTAGGLTLQDISLDGSVLLTRDNERLGIRFHGAGEKALDLSWKDWSTVADISADGKQLLFGEEGENSGSSYEVGLRPTDGAAPVILGSGYAQSLSPDGKWALTVMPPPSDQIALLPTGAEASKVLERGSIEHYRIRGAKWFPDGKRVVFVASEAGHGPRCYVQSVVGGKPQPFTAEGMLLCTVSPEGRVLALAGDYRAWLYPPDAGASAEKEFRLASGELPVGWAPDGKFLYLLQTEAKPITIVQFDLESGRRRLWLRPDIEAGTEGKEIVLTPDGRSYAYTYSRHFSDLYLVQGLKLK